MRITDAEDDYTVTADQRAALMELETLTWNYPTPQQARGRSGIPATSFPSDDQTDTDDDDDEDSYYVDIPPYDMTERLKEVNRAFIEDPTPAECNRAITVRFREVIADYQSPREYYPSGHNDGIADKILMDYCSDQDSDDGYGDSSDLVYDAEEESGLTSLTTDVKDVLTDNVNVIDFISHPTQSHDFSDFTTLSSNLNGFSDDGLRENYKSSGLKSSLGVNDNKSSLEERKTDIPRLQLGGKEEECQPKPAVDNFVSPTRTAFSAHVPSESELLKVDDSGLADLESFMKDTELGEEIAEDLPRDSVSLLEGSNQVYVDKGFSSLDNVTRAVSNETESESNAFFQRKETKELLSSSNQQLPAKSEADFATYDYDDDFEEFQEEEDEESRVVEKETEKPVSPSASPTVPNEQSHDEKERKIETHSQSRHEDPRLDKKAKQVTIKDSPQKQGHKSRRDQSTRKSSSSSTDRTKKRTESKSPSESTTEASIAKPKPKRVAAGPPTIKPALLSSDKISHMKTSEPNKYKTRSSSSSSRPVTGTAASTSSPAGSASSSSSSSSSASTPGSLRGRSRTPISGPVRPTQHKSPVGGRISTRGISNSPVRSSTSPAHHGLALTPSNPAQVGQTASTINTSGRPSPPYRVRKAASASDLHSPSRVADDPEDRRRQSEAVFKAWLQQKNKQAALAKRHQRKTSEGRNTSEISERRARAEEAFQAWLARKRDQLRLEKKLRGERRRLEDQNRYARTKAECEVAYKEWCRRKSDEVRTVRPNGVVPRSQSLERPWVQEKTRKLYSAYLNGH